MKRSRARGGGRGCVSHCCTAARWSVSCRWQVN